MAMPKLTPSYEAMVETMPKGFNHVCTGCKETYTIYPKDNSPLTYSCWCGTTRQFTTLAEKTNG